MEDIWIIILFVSNNLFCINLSSFNLLW